MKQNTLSSVAIPAAIVGITSNKTPNNAILYNCPKTFTRSSSWFSYLIVVVLL